MPLQLNLPGIPSTPVPLRLDSVRTPTGTLQGYLLFLAIFPELRDAHRLAVAARGLRRLHGLGGALLSPGRLHMTLHAIAGFRDTVPRAIVDASVAAAASVRCSPLPFVFDQVLSFKGSTAFVLRCSPGSNAAVARLRLLLAMALRRSGLQPRASCTPHMTMLYDGKHIARQSIQPMCWTATRLALVLSHVGVGHHQWMGQWTLADESY